MDITFAFIVNSMHGKVVRSTCSAIHSVSIDTRTLKPQALFFALPGTNVDGNNFAVAALKRGASAVVVSRLAEGLEDYPDRGVILVSDTVEALQQLARSYRDEFTLPIVAVTGSVGKTTTRDILASCLEQDRKTLRPTGNFNNEIGLPLTILELEPNYRAAVVEMAMRGRGEIAKLASIARPTCAIITNVEPVHLETMLSLENIARAKCEVLEGLGEDGFALINGDNHLLVKTAADFKCNKYSFGSNRDCDIEITGVQSLSKGLMINLRLFDVQDSFFFPLPVPELAADVAAAAGAAMLLGVAPDDLKRGLANYHTSSNRLHIIDLKDGGKVINDTYNANPVSMVAALQMVKKLAVTGKAVAVLGDMLELGSYEVAGHMQVGKKAAELGIDLLVVLGPRAAHIAGAAIEAGMKPEAVKQFIDRQECLTWLRENVSKSDMVMFKASRGMKMETLLEQWMA